MSSQPAPLQESDSDETDLLDLIQTVAENIRLLVLLPLGVGFVALAISFIITPTFTGITVFLPPQQQQSNASALLQGLGALGGVASATAGLKDPNAQYVTFLKSRHIQDRLIERFKLKERYDVELQFDARKELAGNTKVTSGKDGLLTLTADDTDPVFAAQLANAYVEELSKLMELLALTEAQQRRAFFESKLQITKDKLTKAEIELSASGVNSSAIKSNPQAAVETVARLQAEIAGQEIKLASMRNYLAETAPALKQALAELSAQRLELSKLEKSNGNPSTTDNEYITRFREFKYQETLLEIFAKQYELAKVDESREGAAIQVVDVALAPEKKSKPRKGIIAVVTTLATGTLLLLFVFMRVRYRKAVSDPKAADKIFAIKQALRRTK